MKSRRWLPCQRQARLEGTSRFLRVSELPFIPEYAKPDAPGVHMGFDNSVSIYHVVGPEDSFETAAQDVFTWLRDFYEFQQEFWFSTVAPFVTAFETPMTGPLVNPDRQRNDVPDALRIGGDDRPHTGQVIPDAG